MTDFQAWNGKLAEDEFWVSGGSEFQSSGLEFTNNGECSPPKRCSGIMEWKEPMNRMISYTQNVIKKKNRFGLLLFGWVLRLFHADVRWVLGRFHADIR